jgi:hypothetical protein
MEAVKSLNVPIFYVEGNMDGLCESDAEIFYKFTQTKKLLTKLDESGSRSVYYR